MAKKKATQQPQPVDNTPIDVAELAQQGQPAEHQATEAVPVASEPVLTLTETAEPVKAVVTRGVPKPPTPGLKVQLRNRKTGRIVAMSVNKELALALAAQNKNIEII